MSDCQSTLFRLSRRCYAVVLSDKQVSAFLCRTIRERAVITESGPGEGASIVQLADPDPALTAAAAAAAVVDPTSMEVETDPLLVDFDFEKFLNDFAATPGGLGDGFIGGPSGADGSGPTPAALTPRYDDSALDAGTSTVGGGGVGVGDFSLSVDEFGAPNEMTSYLDDVKIAGLRSFFQDAKLLFNEVENWVDEVSPEKREARVLVGNKTHQLAMMVCNICFLFACSWPWCVDCDAERRLSRSSNGSASTTMCSFHSRIIIRKLWTEYGCRVRGSSPPLNKT